MKKTLLSISIIVLVSVIFLTACSTANDSSIPYASIPAGKAYADGQEIYFSHTEVSDPGVADKLTKMMKSPVLLVPSLANAPDSMLANVYVFTNGIKGKGPLGFQSDVFNFPPGTDGYSPLRKITFVTWADGSKPVELKSEGVIIKKNEVGEVTLETSNIVVNMPFMAWSGGKR